MILCTFIVHAVHDGHQSLEPGHGLSLIALAHEVRTEAWNHTLSRDEGRKKNHDKSILPMSLGVSRITYNDLVNGAHFHDVLKLLIHVPQRELTCERDMQYTVH